MRIVWENSERKWKMAELEAVDTAGMIVGEATFSQYSVLQTYEKVQSEY
jgi:hypothetical protein